MTANLIVLWAGFDDLSNRDLHDLLKLRQDVFIVEQACVFPEIDGKDPEAVHLLLKDPQTGALAGALRLFVAPDEGTARIGRVVIARSHRGTGLGSHAMVEGLRKAREMLPGCRVDVSAQAHLQPFYRALGFQTVSAIYLEDDIPHIDMRLSA